MLNRKKRLILIILSFLLLGIIVCFIILMPKKPSRTLKNSSVSSDIIQDRNTDVNSFVIRGKLSQDKSEFFATLSLKGDISICRYSISLKYDTAILELADYDEQLGVYTPVIFPGKDESGKITEDGFGRVNLEWASAKNITKESDIVELTFNIKDKSAKKTNIEVLVKDVNKLKDSTVIDADYNKSDLTINLK